METKLKQLLAREGISISQFARTVGVSQPTLHRIANGQVRLESVNVGNFMRIAHGLGMSAEELFYDEAHYESDKRLIDRVYASTCYEGRQAMLANARGVRDAYPPASEYLLPVIGEDLPDFEMA